MNTTVTPEQLLHAAIDAYQNEKYGPYTPEMTISEMNALAEMREQNMAIDLEELKAKMFDSIF